MKYPVWNKVDLLSRYVTTTDSIVQLIQLLHFSSSTELNGLYPIQNAISRIRNKVDLVRRQVTTIDITQSARVLYIIQVALDGLINENPLCFTRT